MYVWSAEMIRFLEDAAARTDYYRRLAAHVGAQLPPQSRVCDVGSGLGQLAEALCPWAGQVTAVERDTRAVAAFRTRLGEAPPANLQLLEADAFALDPALRFDVMIFCYFGSLDQVCRIAARHCTGTVFLIRRAYREHRFDPGHSLRQTPTVEETLETLAQRGIACDVTALEADFGQPLRSEADAVRFFTLYQRTEGSLTFTQLAPMLRRTEDPDFPFLFPHRKRVAVLRFSAKGL